ncbi:hypothetical protein DZF79_28665 [Vibrio parahaemolyticus]|nr:hypothetical protein [Vibrio parahaemolyticus]
MTLLVEKDVVTTVIDPKGDCRGLEKSKAKVEFWNKGQKPYGEWMKKIGLNDTPPRGKCSKYFKTNSGMRRPVAMIDFIRDGGLQKCFGAANTEGSK